MSYIAFTKEGSIDVQVSFQEIWGQMPIDKRNKLFDRFVRVTEFLESLVLIAPSNRMTPYESCSKITCQHECEISDNLESYWHSHVRCKTLC